MTRTKREQRERRDVIIVIVLFFLCAILFGVGSLLSFQTSSFHLMGFQSDENAPAQQATKQPKPTAKATTEPSVTPTRPSSQQDNGQKDAKNGFAVPRSKLINAFIDEGFTFQDGVNTQQRQEINGKSANQLAALQLVGKGETLTKMQFVIHYPKSDSEALKANLGYVVKSLKLVAPQWKDAVIWFYANVAELAKQKEEPRQTSITEHGLTFFLKLTTMPDLLFLICETAAAQ